MSSRPEVGAGYGHSRVGQDGGGEFSGPGRHTIHLYKNNTNTCDCILWPTFLLGISAAMAVVLLSTWPNQC